MFLILNGMFEAHLEQGATVRGGGGEIKRQDLPL